MKYLKYLKHWIAIHPMRSLLILLLLLLFVAVLFYFRKSIISILKNIFLELKTNRIVKYVLVILILFVTLIVVFFISTKFKEKTFKSENINISNTNYLFGIDISHHNGEINWDEVKKSKHPIKYVFIKATEGKK